MESLLCDVYLVAVQHVSQVALGQVEDGGGYGLGLAHGLGRGGRPRRTGLLAPPPAPLPPAPPRLRQLLLDLLNVSEHLAGQRLQGRKGEGGGREDGKEEEKREERDEMEEQEERERPAEQMEDSCGWQRNKLN